MRNNLVILLFCSGVSATAQVPDTVARLHSDTAQSMDYEQDILFADTSLDLPSDSLVCLDSLTAVDSALAMMDSVTIDSAAPKEAAPLCISDVIVLPIISSGPYTYPWYALSWNPGGPCIYTVTRTDWPSCCWVPDPPPFPVRSFEDLIDPPTEKTKPAHTFVVYNADNFTPVPEEKEHESDSLPFIPELKWITALYPTPFRSRR